MARWPLTALLLIAPALPAAAQEHGDPDTGFDLVLARRQEAPPGTDLRVTTTTVYPCTGYRLRVTTTRSGDTIAVDIGGLVRPNPCLPSADPAEGSVYLGSFGGGLYHILVRYRGASDLYRLRFTTGAARPTALRASFTTLRGY